MTSTTIQEQIDNLARTVRNALPKLAYNLNTSDTIVTATGSTTARTLADWMKDVSEGVRFTSQELTVAQKAKARENIDVFNINAEYEKLDDFIFAFGYYRAWANANTDNEIKRNYSECLVSSDGVSFHNAGNFDTTFKDGLNECRWGYIPEFYDSKLYLSSTYGLKAWYYITDDLKNFSVYEYPITIENTGVEIEGADAAPMVTLKNVNGTWYSIIQMPTNTPVTVPDGGGGTRAKRVNYIATGNPDTNTWGEPELFTELNSLSTSLFDVTFYEDSGTYYILGQEMTTRKLKLFKSSSFLSGYSLVKEFNVSYFLETPTVVKYKGKYFIYAMAYETGTLVCFVSEDMETWSQASGIYYDRILNFDKRGGNLRFIKCLVADTDEKRRLIFNYMRYSGSTVNLANDFVYKHNVRYGTHIKIDPNIVNGSKVNTTFSNFVLVPGSIYTLEDNVQITITGFDTSLMGRGDKCWFLVKHNAKNPRIMISSSARSDSFSWGKNEFLGYDSLSFGVVTNTNNELIEISAEFVDYKIICYLDVDLNKQVLATSAASVDLNNIQFTSFWTFTGSQASNGSNFPTTVGGLLVVKAHGNTIYQEYMKRNPDLNVYRRMFNPGVGWYDWVQNTL